MSINDLRPAPRRALRRTLLTVVITGSKQTAQKPIGGARPHKDPVSNGSRRCACSLERRSSVRSLSIGPYTDLPAWMSRSAAPADGSRADHRHYGARLRFDDDGAHCRRCARPYRRGSSKNPPPIFRFRAEPDGFHAGRWSRVATSLSRVPPIADQAGICEV